MYRREAFSGFAAKYYTGRRYTLYEQAAQFLMHNTCEAKHAMVRCFVKMEKFVETYVEGGIKRQVPRLIQPRNPIYNCAVGTFIKQLEHPFYGICR